MNTFTNALPLANCLLAVALLAGCKGDGSELSPDQPKKGHLTGKVTDPQGKPLKGAEIVADNTWLYNSNLVTRSDANGAYSIALPAAASTYQATAQLQVSYHGQTYELDLRPDEPEGFTQDGAVRNFQWALNGEYPDHAGRFYGGTITLDKEIGSELYDVENILFTLTPVGPLIDGSTGKTLKLKSGQPRTNSYGKLVDVPIGRYRISAVHEPSGAKIRVRNKNGTFAADGTVTLDFYGNQSPWYCFNCMVIEYGE
ncbi:carboxypeptidase-like regulatory domain-containing protein [Larkinella sp. VNQ87]|uniref:carboxypeptidase-like regulatory domain-containing protein n=1 Tax=Larkinella sp. VNQ87 TaxID=3400921 RepID=UPI003BFEEC48